MVAGGCITRMPCPPDGPPYWEFLSNTHLNEPSYVRHLHDLLLLPNVESVALTH